MSLAFRVDSRKKEKRRCYETIHPLKVRFVSSRKKVFGELKKDIAQYRKRAARCRVSFGFVWIQHECQLLACEREFASWRDDGYPDLWCRFIEHFSEL